MKPPTLGPKGISWIAAPTFIAVYVALKRGRKRDFLPPSSQSGRRRRAQVRGRPRKVTAVCRVPPVLRFSRANAYARAPDQFYVRRCLLKQRFPNCGRQSKLRLYFDEGDCGMSCKISKFIFI